MNEIKIDRGLARWAALGVSAIALIVMAVALLLNPLHQLDTTSYIALGAAVVGVAAFVLIDPESLTRSITGRTGQYGITTVLMSVFFIAFVIALYVIVRESKIDPWDLTAVQKYQMSDQSIQLVKGITEDIQAIAFIPDTVSEQRKEAEIWLQRYSTISNGKITYEFIDPERSPGVAAQYNMSRAGVIVFKKGEETAEASFADERNITGALVQLLAGEKRIAYMITGHGERAVDDFAPTGFSTAQDLLTGVNFEIKSLNLLGFETSQIPDDADLIIIAGPATQFSQSEADSIKAYLDKGGKALVMLEPTTSGSAGILGSNGVMGVAFNADGTRFATSGADGTAKIWDTTSGREILTLRGHTTEVADVKFSPDGTRIATASADGTILIWDANTGNQIGELEGQTEGVGRVAFSPNGEIIVSVGANQVMNIWDASNLQPKSYSPLSTPNPLYSVVISPDSTKIAAGGGSLSASGTGEGTVYIWDAESGTELVNKTLHTSLVLDLKFSVDGAALYSVASDGTAGTLDVATGEGSTEALYPGVGITGFAILSDTVRVYTLRNGEVHVRTTGESGTQDKLLNEHTAFIWGIAPSPDGKTFVTGSRDGTARVWSTDSDASLLQITGHSTQDALLSYLNASWGVTANDDTVVDVASAQIYQLDPTAPVISGPGLGVSPITQTLRDHDLRILMIAARTLTISESVPAGITLTPLAMTSNYQVQPDSGGPMHVSSWGETDLLAGIRFDEEDAPGPSTVGVSGENSATGARIVVFGDTDLASTEGLSSGAANNELFLNSVNWLTENENLLNLPTTPVTPRTIDRPLDPLGVGVLAFGVTCLIPIIMLVVGAVVWIIRRRKR